MTKKFQDLTGKEMELLLADIGKKAIAEAHGKGLATTHADEKGVYLLYPDNHKEYIKED